MIKSASQEQELLRAKLNMETAQMPWRELQRYFASGHIIAIGAGLDMVNVAVMIATDDAQSISLLLKDGQIEKVTDTQAQAWYDLDASLWTVVVKPWILVQEEKFDFPKSGLLN
jgi:hypothetical protein